MKKFQINTLLCALITLGAAAPASAVMVNYSVDGVITEADAGNAFGLNVNDSVSMSGTFDVADPANATVIFDVFSGNTMEISLGSILLTEANDFSYLDGLFPVLEFSGGDLVATDIAMEIGVNGSLVDFFSIAVAPDLFFDGFDMDDKYMAGFWLPDTLVVSAADAVDVPEPGMLVLLGSSLIGFRIARRRRTS